jgi:hypothetical protein
VAGKYQITAQVQITAGVGGPELFINLLLNSFNNIATAVWAASTLNGPRQITTLYDLVPGDYVEVTLIQVGGVAGTIDVAPNRAADFMMVRVDT